MTITRNKTRSLLTGFGVFWGILMLVILLGSGNGLKNGVLKNVDGFSTNSAFFFSERTGEPYKGYKKGRYWQMRNRDLETIRQRVKGVRYLSPMIMQWGGQNNVVRGQKAGTYNVRGVYSEYFNIETQHILAGRLLNEIDMIEKRKVCLIGNIVREVLFAPDEDPIGQYIRVNGIYYQVVGVIKPKPRAQIGGGAPRRLWLTDAPLWILDEPFTALDATAMETLTRRLEQHARQGGCAILTTHQPLRPLGCPLRTLRLGGDAGGGE